MNAMKITVTRQVLVLAVLMSVAGLVVAGSTTAHSADTTGCTPQERQQANQNLSQKLDDAAAVICPPDVDPGMKAPTPKAGNTPVIPPPGSPGGDPNVQPK
jgi:hypothetical protein